MITDILIFALFVLIVWGSFIWLLVFAVKRDRHSLFTRDKDNR